LKFSPPFALIAAVSGLLAVMLAAAGAHIVPQGNTGAEKLWDTALQMHLFHTVSLLGIAALMKPDSPKGMTWSGILMVFGVLFFSGSLYLRAGGLATVPGPVTPLGGLLLMAAWMVLVMTLIRKNRL
jgi:uncharacterized membrane protein YgdD (TMEM256/DUF423 family)